MSKVSNFDKSLQKLGVLFRYSGMYLPDKIDNPATIFKYRCVFALNSLWILFATFTAIYLIIINIVRGKNFVEITSVTPCVSWTLVGSIKAFIHMKHEKEIKNLIDLLRYVEIKENNREKCEEKEKIIDNEVAFLNRVVNVLLVLNISMVIVFDMIPLILIAVKYYKTQEFELLLPYMDVFIFLPNEIKYWPFAYIQQIWSECVVLLEMTGADFLLYTCCTYIRLQFRLLKYDIERSIPPISISKGELYDKTEFQAKFVELVQWHQNLIEATQMLENIYSKSTLCNFLSSSFVICLTGFNVTIVNDVTIIITFFTFLLMALMQVFFVCHFADMMMSASVDVSDGVYNSRWYLANAAVGRQLLLVQTRAMEPCKLTAAGFADVNLRAYMRILSTAWSYFALLQTVYGG